MSALNAQLIDAVESGREDDVKRLIDAGASPDLRKVVTMRAKVDTGRGWLLGAELKEDTAACESALAIAILHGIAPVVRVLLEMGAKVDSEVEWKIANGWIGDRAWTASEWDQERWF
ncbi:hypothetical protein M427DRAFT_35066 [Gonapodya prolifera JEL478]|uniref:Ankyrin n=1 Tax=Gonapodya prolifera (strain JEL478) TaxID=1344416 RepID=A0A139A5C0_GONPJ|nr:hypothetical protein M427DRAFT_35066 [Gonapodya prolifera JEL478]|eukprot:KXS11990.1 hypothetical protein M427DRAFT_35066 [Gonapodya prolifera JEL478]